MHLIGSRAIGRDDFDGEAALAANHAVHGDVSIGLAQRRQIVAGAENKEALKILVNDSQHGIADAIRSHGVGRCLQ